jgi:glycosyltransferase involved in cell wall biosynthesis
VLQAHIIEHRPLLIHGFGAPWAWFAAVAAKQVDAPAVFANVDEHYLGDVERNSLVQLAQSLGLPVDTVWKRLYTFLGENVDRYVTTTREDMEIATEFVAGQKLEVALGGYGVDVQALNPYESTLPSHARLRESMGLPSRLVVGAPHDLESAKFDELERQLNAILPAVALVSLEDVEVSDLRHYFRALDLFVVPEDSPRWCQLAAASATAVVACDTRGNREVVAEGETGLLTESAGLAAAAAELLGDPARIDKFGVRARTRAVSRFDSRQVDDQMLRLYDAVLRGKLA